MIATSSSRRGPRFKLSTGSILYSPLVQSICVAVAIKHVGRSVSVGGTNHIINYTVHSYIKIIGGHQPPGAPPSPRSPLEPPPPLPPEPPGPWLHAYVYSLFWPHIYSFIYTCMTLHVSLLACTHEVPFPLKPEMNAGPESYKKVDQIKQGCWFSAPAEFVEFALPVVDSP